MVGDNWIKMHKFSFLKKKNPEILNKHHYIWCIKELDICRQWNRDDTSYFDKYNKGSIAISLKSRLSKKSFPIILPWPLRRSRSPLRLRRSKLRSRFVRGRQISQEKVDLWQVYLKSKQFHYRVVFLKTSGAMEQDTKQELFTKHTFNQLQNIKILPFTTLRCKQLSLIDLSWSWSQISLVS